MAEQSPIEFWFTIASTYTYLTVMRLNEIEKSTGVQFSWRPFNRQAVGKNVPFPEDSAKRAYMWRDIERRAGMYSIPLRVPVPYPPKDSAFTNRVALVRGAYRRRFQLGQVTQPAGLSRA
jgi:2-hydroxychromene-2-carboxylate isomerase